MRVLVAALLLLSLPARADDERGARESFERGTAALRSGRVAEARDLFRQSLAALATAPTAFNLAVALRGTGETSESIDFFDALLEQRWGPLTEERRAEVQRLRRETHQELATIEVENSGAFGIAVTLARPDERPVPEGARTFEVAPSRRGRVRVDAGAYDVRAEAPGRVTATHRLEVARGGRASWEPVLLEQTATETVVAPTPPARSGARVRSTPLIERPWFWIATGAAVIVTAGLVTWVALDDRTGDPVSDEVFGVVEALTRR